jgi:hypothetical protein
MKRRACFFIENFKKMATSTSKKREQPSYAEIAENNQAPEREVLLSEKFKVFWEYHEKEKELQELELKRRKLTKEMTRMSDLYPELLQAKGLADRMFNTTLMNIKDEGTRIWIPANDKEEAHTILKARNDSKQKEKVKLEQRKKKVKLVTSSDPKAQ